MKKYLSNVAVSGLEIYGNNEYIYHYDNGSFKTSKDLEIDELKERISQLEKELASMVNDRMAYK